MTVTETSPAMLVLVIPSLLLAGVATWLAMTGRLAVTGPIWALVTWAMAVSLAACVRVRIIVDEGHLRVRSWLVGVTLMLVRLGEVRSVKVETSRATRWGNWGLRLMLWGKMLVVRGDKALVLQLENSRDVVFVVRDAEYLALEVKQRLTSRSG